MIFIYLSLDDQIQNRKNSKGEAGEKEFEAKKFYLDHGLHFVVCNPI